MPDTVLGPGDTRIKDILLLGTHSPEGVTLSYSIKWAVHERGVNQQAMVTQTRETGGGPG